MRLWHLFAICISIFLFLQGCVTIPTDEATLLLDQTPPLNDMVKEALASSHFYEGGFPKKAWWELFDDPQLSSLIVLGLKANPSLKELLFRVTAAQEQAKIKRAALFPMLGLGGNLDAQHLGRYSFFRAYTPMIPANVTEYVLGLDLSYEVDFWGRNRNIYKAALGEAKASQAEWAAAELALSSSIATVYMQLQADLAKLDLLKQERAVLREILHLTKLKQEHALDSNLPLLTSQKDFLVINKMVLALQQEIDLFKHSLQELIGEGPQVKKALEEISLYSWQSLPLPVDLSANLLSRRPDLIAQLWHVEAMAHLVGAAKADFYPNINLAAFGGLDSIFTNKLFSWQSRSGWVKPAFYLPIFTGGKLTANLKAHRAQFHAAIESYNATLLKAVREVADKIVTLSSLAERLDVEEALVKNRSQDKHLSSLRYKKGIDSLFPLLDAEDKLLQEKAHLITLQADQAVSLIALMKALGGGYVDSALPLTPNGNQSPTKQEDCYD